MDLFGNVMNKLGAREMPVFDSDFETGSRNYMLKEDGFVIKIFESVSDFENAFCVLVSKDYKNETVQKRYLINSKLMHDPYILKIIRYRVELCKQEINKSIKKHASTTSNIQHRGRGN